MLFQTPRLTSCWVFPFPTEGKESTIVLSLHRAAGECVLGSQRGNWAWLKLPLFTGDTGKASQRFPAGSSLFGSIYHPGQVHFYSGSLSLWAPKGVLWGFPGLLGEGPMSTQHKPLTLWPTWLAWKVLMDASPKTSARLILLPLPEHPFAICSPFGMPRAHEPQATAPSTFSGIGDPMVLWASQVQGIQSPSTPTPMCLWSV